MYDGEQGTTIGLVDFYSIEVQLAISGFEDQFVLRHWRGKT